MTRIDSETLATHLEVALTSAPQHMLTALQHADSHRRRRSAAFNLARHLAHRLGCFELISEPFAMGAQQQESLFEEAPRTIK